MDEMNNNQDKRQQPKIEKELDKLEGAKVTEDWLPSKSSMLFNVECEFFIRIMYVNKCEKC